MTEIGAVTAEPQGQAKPPPQEPARHGLAPRVATTAPPAALDVADRSLAVVAALMQAYVLLDVTRLFLLPSGGRPWVAAAVAVAAVTCVLALVLRRRRWAVVVNVVALSVVALALLLDPPMWAAGRYVTNVALAVAGLRLGTRAAMAYSVAVVVAEGLLLGRAAALAPATGPGLQGALLWPLYDAATAATAVLAARALRRASAAVDVAHTALLHDRRAAEVAAAVERDAARDERVLHDTVLNTLTAIARGGLDDRRPAVRRRCADCADQVRRLLGTEEVDGGTGSTSLAELVAEAADSCRATGCRVHVDEVDLAGVPAEVRVAVAGAVSEALRNVERHAGAATADVRGSTDGGRVVVRVRDNGRGFDPGNAPRRLGLARAVLAAVTAVGGTATVESEPGAGTAVTVEWAPGPDRSVGIGLADDVGKAVAAVVPAVLLPFLAVAWVSAAATWQDLVSPWATVAALLAYTALAATLLRTAARQRSYRTRDVLLGLAGAACVAILAAVGLGGPIAVAGGDFGSWGDEAVLSVLLVLTALGPPWTLVPALALQVAVHGLVRVDQSVPGVVLLLVVGLFAWSVRRAARRYEHSVAEGLAERVRRDAVTAAMAGRIHRYQPLTEGALPLLDALADGGADPADPAVRQAARVEERYARTLVTVDPADGPAEAMVLRLAALAHRRALVLHADVVPPATGDRGRAPGPDLDVTAARHAEHALAAVLERLPVDGVEPRLTVMAEPGGWVVRLVGPLPAPPARPAGLAFEALADQGLWEVAIPRA